MAQLFTSPMNLQKKRYTTGPRGARRFAHILIQDVVYNEIPPPVRRDVHGGVAARLAGVPKNLMDVGFTLRLARHFELSAQPIEAARWYQQSISRLLGIHDEQAYEYCLVALEILEERLRIEPTRARLDRTHDDQRDLPVINPANSP